MKKKIISVVLGFFVVASTLFTILALNITPVTLKRDIFEYEYGSVISNNPADYVNANESVINEVKLNFSNLKNEIGLYKVSATYAGVELPFYIKIKDTTKPVFTLKQVVFNINVNEKIAAWDERLKTVFNRGFWDGYYLGQRLGEWTRNYGSAATERKIYVGKGIKYFSNIGVSEFLVEAAEVSVGDKLLITGPTTGAVFMTLDEARVDLEPVQTVKKGQHFSMKSDKIRPSDKLYKLVSTEELKKFKGLDIEQKRG